MDIKTRWVRAEMKEQPKIIETLKRKCFVCNKQHIMMAGSLAVVKMFSRLHKGTQYMFERRAPLSCWLANNTPIVKTLYEDKEWVKAHKIGE